MVYILISFSFFPLFYMPVPALEILFLPTIVSFRYRTIVIYTVHYPCLIWLSFKYHPEPIHITRISGIFHRGRKSTTKTYPRNCAANRKRKQKMVQRNVTIAIILIILFFLLAVVGFIIFYINSRLGWFARARERLNDATKRLESHLHEGEKYYVDAFMGITTLIYRSYYEYDPGRYILQGDLFCVLRKTLV
ncbi:uncharacterized protein MCYG_08560 [Microsporum canis CBS 113480]|uniref:Uncharacterized protein n=1 Tax=Arthroderma otae (strain ATCC MYA-4605 / CBS 113480) TaxID=554155 RepID=C5G0T8_ARTOC|nr:uncharacterized protein MCYG_08560 [Microsporum canis CBS 113480]EEQ35741.1 predicted protein [Microsporum canis CBS 113480]